MEINKSTAQRIMVYIVRSVTKVHTATSLAKELQMSRWGVWKILKKLQKEELILLEPVGEGKTSAQQIQLNWENIVVEKMLIFSLTQEAVMQRRWRYNFAALEHKVDFVILFGSILHSPEKANDIDILTVVLQAKKLVNLDRGILKIQGTQQKKIHAINLTQKEFVEELKRLNRAYIDAVKKGIVLFGQEKFVQCMKRLQT